MSEKFLSRASQLCGASFVVIACAVSCLFVGCEKKTPPQRPVVAPESLPDKSHMKDPALKQKLRGQIDEQQVLARARQTIVAKMEELVQTKYKGDMKAAANDPELKSLIRRAHDIEANFASNRVHTAEMIRARANKNVSEKKEMSK